MDPNSTFSDPKSGVLLFGPPGTGKTSIGRALAHRMKGKMFMVKEIFLMKQLQETFARAEACAPSVVFFDDIDVLLHRSKVAWSGGEVFRFLLSKMDGLCSGKDSDKNRFVTIIMTCESPRSLPEALIRSGRIELWLKLEHPKAKQRAVILENLLRRESRSINGAKSLPELADVDLKTIRKVANKTEDFSAADLRRLVKDTRNMLAYREAKKTSAKSDEQGEEGEEGVGETLEKAVENLRRMRDEVESFMRQMYQ